LSRYGRCCSELMARWQQRAGLGIERRAASAAARIRVGIVSAQVRDHSVYRALIKGWLDQLDRSRFEVGIVHVGLVQDGETNWARQRAAFFVDGDRTLGEWVETVRQLELDVLIYPEIGMDPTTLRLAGLRLAPHQIAAWGHPETTGLPTIDHYLSAELFEPAESQDYYSERLVRLPHLGCYYEPFRIAARPVDFAACGIRTDSPVLLCPGTPFKYAPRHDATLVEIARRLGRCQLIFFRPAAPALSLKLGERLAAAFRTARLDPDEYLVFLPWKAPQDFFGLLGQADLYLDTMGFSGFNTAMQAVECGLPLATYEGRFMRGRLASAIMHRLGMPELVAHDPREYVDLAVRLIEDRAYNQDVRTRIQASRGLLYRDDETIAGLSDLLSSIVRDPNPR
jgi:protein O-GlcNAc transferase